jgi:hypothetical protein
MEYFRNLTRRRIAMKTLCSFAANGYQLIVATSALFILTAPSLALAADSPNPFAHVHSLRADNGDFDTWGAGTVESRTSFGLVDPVQTGSGGSIGAINTSKCLGISPRMYDPLSPDCRN